MGREKGEGRREKGEGRREKGEGRRKRQIAQLDLFRYLIDCACAYFGCRERCGIEARGYKTLR